MEVKVPQLPESVADATLVSWHRKVGEAVKRDENLVDLETDKVVLEVPAPANGILTEIRMKDGSTVTSGEILAVIEPGDEAADAADPPESTAANGGPATDAKPEAKAKSIADAKPEAKAKPAAKPTPEPEEARREPAPKTAASAPDNRKASSVDAAAGNDDSSAARRMGPAVRKLVDEHDLDPARISASGRDGRLTKGDVIDFIETHRDTNLGLDDSDQSDDDEYEVPTPGDRREHRVQMTRLRQRIAERLVESQRTAAMLTTFNHVDMSEIVDLRKKYQEEFQARYDIKLGFMSFFVRAVIGALRVYPVLNASIDGTDIVYHEYFDIGVAVSTERGLIVPVIKNAQNLNMGQIETSIRGFGLRAKSGEIGMEELTGGTFTITNGGIFGSMMSTPILNPPQCGILGMHAIEDRPVVVDGEIVIRPMMYLALSYDHRIVDGREAVRFLVHVKGQLEDPARLVLQI
jgi:2-oxoglutarate dehydrogenase E2 component (dihydrolipoamide succinyltransferase)